MARRRPSSVFLIVMASSLAAAQEAPDFLAGRDGYDRAIAGPLHFGVHVAGGQNIGQMHLTFEPAPEGSGGVYQAALDGRMQLGPSRNTGRTIALLDAGFALVSKTDAQQKIVQGEASSEESRVGRTADRWVETRTVDGEETTREIEAVGPVYEAPISYLLIARTIPLETGTVATIRTLEFDEESCQSVAIEVGEVGPYAHRGQEIDAFAVRFVEAEGKTFIVRVTAARRILAVEFHATPIAMIAGTEEEAGQDIASSVPEGAGADSPRSAVETYFRVLSGASKVDALDGVFDWEAIQREMAGSEPSTREMSAATIAAILKGQFEKLRGTISGEQVELLLATLEVEEDGLEATAKMPDEDDPFRLRKTETGWKIVHFPH